MKFREVVEVNQSPKIEQLIKINDNIILIATSNSIYAFNSNTNKIEEVEFTKDTK